jgi:hypothetical protein
MTKTTVRDGVGLGDLDNYFGQVGIGCQPVACTINVLRL